MARAAAVVAVAGLAAACGGGAAKPTTHPATSASAVPTVSSVFGLPLGAIDRARVLAACVDIRQADTLLSGGLPAAQVRAQLLGAVEALAPALATHPDLARLATAWRAAVTVRTERVAIAAGLAWCGAQHA